MMAFDIIQTRNQVLRTAELSELSVDDWLGVSLKGVRGIGIIHSPYWLHPIQIVLVGRHPIYVVEYTNMCSSIINRSWSVMIIRDRKRSMELEKRTRSASSQLIQNARSGILGTTAILIAPSRAITSAATASSLIRVKLFTNHAMDPVRCVTNARDCRHVCICVWEKDV